MASANIYLTVPVTNLVEIPNLDMTEEIFSAGSDDRTLRWEIYNQGNVADSFDISLTHSSDVFLQVLLIIYPSVILLVNLQMGLEK